MCHKFQLDTKVSTVCDSWIGLKGFGKLKEPSDEVFEIVKQFDDLFDSFHGSGLKKGFGKCKIFIQSKFTDFNPKAILYFCRVTFSAKIRKINKQAQPS